MQGNRGECALVGGSEEIAVEVAFHNLGLAQEAGLDDAVLFQFLLAAYSVVAGVELVGQVDALLFGLVLLLGYGGHGGVERIHGGVELADAVVGGGEAALEGLDFAGLRVNLIAQGGDCVAQIVVGEVGAVELLLKFGKLLATLLQCLLDRSDVGLNLLALAGSFAVNGGIDREYVLKCFDLVHSL